MSEANFSCNLKIRVNHFEFEAPVVIVNTDYAHPIFGRFKGLDRFLAEFDKGREARINYSNI